MSADITIFAYVWGDTHNHFVAEWHNAIQSLHHQPAEVIIATNPNNPAEIDHLPYTIIEDPRVGNLNDCAPWLNMIIDNVQTRWITECDIDDIIYPDAFQHIDDAANHDACATNIQLRTTGAVLASRPERFHAEPWANHCMVNCYFTKDIFTQVGGYPPVRFHDWGLWWKLHKHNAKWFPLPGTQMLYNDIPHANRATDNLTEQDTKRQLDWIGSYDPTNPKD